PGQESEWLMSTFDRLRAKSDPKDLAPGSPCPPSVYLAGHLRDVHEAAVQVLASTGEDQLRALGLAPEAWGERFLRTVRLAAALPAPGKGNAHFQRMLAGDRSRQGLRHEWAPLLMVEPPSLREWFVPAVGGEETQWQVVLWAIAGHHPAYHPPSPPRLFQEGAGTKLRLLVNHEDFHTCLLWLAETFGLSTPPRFAEGEGVPLVRPGNAFLPITAWFTKAAQVWGQASAEEKRFTAAVKDCLVAADVAGSALPREVKDEARRAEWIRNAFGNTPRPGQLRKVVELRLNGN